MLEIFRFIAIRNWFLLVVCILEAIAAFWYVKNGMWRFSILYISAAIGNFAVWTAEGEWGK